MIATRVTSSPFTLSWSLEKNFHEDNHDGTSLFSTPFWSMGSILNEETKLDEDDDDDNDINNDDNDNDEEGFEICESLPKNYKLNHVIILPKKRVSFDYIHVREYERILGDHPDTKMGPPLSLGWKYMEQSRMDIGQYERQRYIQRKSQLERLQQHLKKSSLPSESSSTSTSTSSSLSLQSLPSLRPLSRRTRRRLLLPYHVTDEQIRLVEEENQRISQQRHESRTITPRKEQWELLRETRFHPLSHFRLTHSKTQKYHS
jgi:hypothetical protein